MAPRQVVEARQARDAFDQAIRRQERFIERSQRYVGDDDAKAGAIDDELHILDMQLECVGRSATQPRANAGTRGGAQQKDQLAPRLLIVRALLAFAATAERSSLQQPARQVGQAEAERIRVICRGGIAQHAADVRIKVGADVHRRRLPDMRLPPFRKQRFTLARRQPWQGIGRFVVDPIAADARRSSQPILQRQLGFGQLRTRRDANRNEDKTGVVGQRRQSPARDQRTIVDRRPRVLFERHPASPIPGANVSCADVSCADTLPCPAGFARGCLLG